MTTVECVIGNWGRFQWRAFALIGIVSFLFGCFVMEFDFIAAVPKARCRIPGVNPDQDFEEDLAINLLNGSSQNPAVDLYDILGNRSNRHYAKAFIQRGKEMYCSYCPNFSGSNFSNETEIENEWDDQPGCTTEESIACGRGNYIYDKSQYLTTLSADFDMVCKQGAWKRQLASSANMAGLLIGSIVGGLVSDRIGRRPTILLSGLLCLLGNSATFFVPNYYALCTLQVLNMSLMMAAVIASYTLIMELSGGLPRTSAGIFYQAVFTLGYMYIGGMAYFIRSWKWLHLAAISPALMACLCWFLPESPRWLLVKKRPVHAREILNKICRENGLSEPDDKTMAALAIACTPEKGATYMSIFKNFRLGSVTVMNAYCWFVASTLYYGISKNVAELPGDYYLNYQISALFEYPGFLLAIPMMTKIGRRKTLSLFFGFGSVATILCPFLSTTVPALSVLLAALGKMSAGASFAVSYNYAAELFPTFLRNSSIGFASAVSRIASAIAPQIALLGTVLQLSWFSFLIYGIIAGLGSIVVMFMPETKGRPLPETLEDMMILSRNRKKSPMRSAVVEPLHLETLHVLESGSRMDKI